jgi:hypothetical protein
LHNQFSQVAKSLVFNRPREQPTRQLSRGSRSERPQPQSVLQLGSMASTAPPGRSVAVDRLWKNVDLFGNEGNQRFRRPFAGPQWAARIAQVGRN